MDLDCLEMSQQIVKFSIVGNPFSTTFKVVINLLTLNVVEVEELKKIDRWVLGHSNLLEVF
jgi:hypothetical protein